MTHLFRASLIISLFFGINKVLALLRQYIIAAQFGFSSEIDAFNVANNMPDLIFSIFSGGALAMAFIPVFAEYIEDKGIHLSWKLFSKIATLLFFATAVLSLFISLLATPLVSSQFGVAPGFNKEQQALVVELLQIHLIATLIFSISGLITASLQAHKHFFFPALAPLFYNLGIIVGATVFARIFGIYGLAYGVVLGALMHLLVQIPGIVKYKFRFYFSIDFKDEGVRRVLRLMIPRVLTVLLIQVMFLMRDNFASRLETGSVTALTYGYFIMQVPETLIGTAIGTALLPTLASHINQQKMQEFSKVLTTAFRIIIAASLASTVIISLMLPNLLELVFSFSAQQNSLLTLTARAFMIGLLAHTLLEICVRAFYAKQKATIPLYATGIRAIVFIVFGLLFYSSTGAVGIAAIDSLTVGIETLILLVLLWKYVTDRKELILTIGKTLSASALSVIMINLLFSIPSLPIVLKITFALISSVTFYFAFMTSEIKLILKF